MAFNLIASTMAFRLLVVALLAPTVVAADDAEFAFNLFSDIAPVIALFGDQFARQFMSESLTVIDHIIFALVPLGILTAITAAIRIQGSPVARAFIGRARENRALAEIDLMSSTSGEVCELFNGSSIVRAMGNPKITEFLLFRKKYEDVERNYRVLDEKPGSTKETPTKEEIDGIKGDKSCGIESYGSAISNNCKEMECKLYESGSKIWMQECSAALRKGFGRLSCLLWSVLKPSARQTGSDEEAGSRETSKSPANPTGNKANKATTNDETRAKGNSTTADRLKPPSGSSNLQLNLSSDYCDESFLKKGPELVVAVIVGAILQLGLIVIAAITAFHLSPGNHSLFENKVYGFPCYLAGTIMLSIGTGLCSFIVEHSTTEHSLQLVDTIKDEVKKGNTKHNLDKTKPFSLFWVQKKQQVNDQSFNGYVILAGWKRRVLTSRRNNTHESQQPKAKEKLWQLVTLSAALLAGIGFVTQFMGLRGLAFPCSISQLGATLFMALVRAWIRRRLGRLPENRIALAGYELDFLATQIVFDSEFRDFRWSKQKEEVPEGKKPRPWEFCRWRICTPKPVEFSDATPTPASDRTSRPPPPPPPSSQQLLRVRERLTELSRWNSKASNSALSLALSIELFMNTFFPSDGELLSSSLNWSVKSTRLLDGNPMEEDYIRILVQRNPKDGWKIDLGKIDAALSLWMAEVDAKRQAKETEKEEKEENKDSSDWRRTQAGDNMNFRFGRIVGDNLKDEVLKRDISWWINDVVADQCDPRVSGKVSAKGGKQDWTDGIDLFIGFQSESQGSELASVTDTAIAYEFGLASKGQLPCILAQHLFTSFICTIVKYLPQDFLQPGRDDLHRVEIEGLHMFSSQDFDQTWLRPRLSHRQLSKTVLQMEAYGLGSKNDILLCMIPAFSRNGLLPNQEILNVMPRVRGDQDWVEVAKCHNKLLRRVKEPSNNRTEMLTAAAIIAAMDFLAFAYEPYGECTYLLENELRKELQEIVTKLACFEFRPTMEKLAPFYQLQCRCELFAKIFLQLGLPEKTSPSVQMVQMLKEQAHLIKLEQGSKFLDEEFAIKTLGFNQQHFDLISPVEADKTSELTKDSKLKKEFGSRTHDIFGWSAIHYGSVAIESCPSYHLYRDSLWSKGDGTGSLHNQLDTFGRNILHKIALQDSGYDTIALLSGQRMNSTKILLHQAGLDGMTPLHLWAKHGRLDYIKMGIRRTTEVIRDPELLSKKDRWGRQALHIACQFGHDEVSVELLKMGARSDQLDKFRSSPVEYFQTQKRKRESPKSTREQNIEGQIADDLSNKATSLTEEERKLFLMFSPEPDIQYQNRKTLMHIAVDIADASLIQTLSKKNFTINARDQDGQTPLHYAAKGRNLAVAEQLVKCLGEQKTAALSVKDSDGRTALHTAIFNHNKDIADFLLDFNEREEDLFDNSHDSVLVTACRVGLSQIVPKILGNWPKLINQRGGWDEPPISWACENGYDKVVEELIAYLKTTPGGGTIELNQSAAGMNGYTPLHFAARSSNPRCLVLLLEQESVEIDREDKDGRKPLQSAIDAENTYSARMLLLDKRTSLEERIKYIKELISRRSSAFNSIVSEILQSITNAKLRDGFLIWLFEEIENTKSKSPIASLASYLKQDSCEGLSNPWDVAALLCQVGLREIQETQDADENGLDQDGWSCVDYVKRFDRTGALKDLLSYLERNATSNASHAAPTTLVGKGFQDTVDISNCPTEGHTNCAGVHRVRVIKEEAVVTRACIRSDNCISPERDYFYFEIHVIKESPSWILGIGFCGWDTEKGQMPGWFERSWAYHGDDGKLFVKSSLGSIPSSDFGERGIFVSNCVVGVCLNMKTGQRFCTRNGKRLNMGNSFDLQDERFNYGKLYPCVGFDVSSEGVGLEFEVNFGGSTEHIFQYKGPFVFGEGES